MLVLISFPPLISGETRDGSEDETLPLAAQTNNACGNCNETFPDSAQLETHRDSCDKSALGESESLKPVVEGCEEEEDEKASKMVDVSKEEAISEVDKAIRHSQDTANNNINSEELEKSGDEPSLKTEARSPVVETNEEDGDDQSANPLLPSAFPPSHVTLEALQNTKVAVAQFAANALANNNGDSEEALKELAVLHSTLFQLQHQHVFQLQLIQQLQSQLSMNAKHSDKEEGDEMDDSKANEDRSDGYSDKREEEEDDEEDLGKLEPEVIISR